MNYLKYIVVLFGLGFCLPMTAQNDILFQLEQQLQGGNKRALRDVGTFLDHPNQKETALQIIEKYTLFDNKELIISDLNKINFLNFYYNNEDQIRFSDLLSAFYITPIEQRKAEVQTQNLKPLDAESKADILLQNNISTLQYIEKNEWEKVLQSIQTIASLNIEEGYTFLKSILQHKKVQKLNPKLKRTIFSEILQQLQFQRHPENIKLIVEAIKNKIISLKSMENALKVLANHDFFALNKEEKILQSYALLSDSLQSNVDFYIQKGYEKESHLERTFFYTEVDYYGMLLGLSKEQFIKTNALQDLIQTHHPKAILYIAATFYTSKDSTLFYQNLLSKLTSTQVIVQDKDGKWTKIPNFDANSRLNYLIYWASHYEDYKWDDIRNGFVNKYELQEKQAQYEYFFRQLNSPDEKQAREAYMFLSEGEPIEVLSLIEKYKGIMRSWNPINPSIQSAFLEQIIYLVDFARHHNISHKANTTISGHLTQLTENISPSVRYRLENELIEKMALSDITAIEYWGLIHAAQEAVSFSASRIIDAFYDKYWNEILSSPFQLRLFLKKTVLFSKIDAIGVCKAYATKLDINNELFYKQVKVLQKSESDKDIAILLTTFQQKKEVTAVEKISEKDESKKIIDLVQEIQRKDSLSIKPINQLLTYANENNGYRNIALSALNKVLPNENVLRISIEPLLSVEKEWDFVQSLSLDARRWIELSKNFDNKNSAVLLSKLEEKIADLDLIKKGEFYNNLFRANWFKSAVNEKTLSDEQILHIKQSLQAYLDNVEYISEFEEQNTNAHIIDLENAGSPAYLQLFNTFQLDLDEQTKRSIQEEIIARIQFEHLDKVVEVLEQLSPNPNFSKDEFVRHDFGIPVFDLSEEKNKAEFISNFKQLKPAELYLFYLKKFGVNLTNEKGTLDFEKIYAILKQDIIQPFASQNANRRDWYVFSTIKLLEYHFNTTLGFHPKLNENQTFYAFNSIKRANAWAKYLETKQLVKPKNQATKMFNMY